MANKKESLTAKERRAQKLFISKLQVKKRKTKKPVIIAMVGLVGSGKTTVAKELAKFIGATIIEGDRIRVELRKQNEKYGRVKKIARNAALEVIKQGNNIIVDADLVIQNNRAYLQKIIKDVEARLFYVRTYADFDVMAGRVITAKYQNKPEDFFGGASSKWQGSSQIKGAVVKIREMWRRTPHHYRWENEGGGKWLLKKLPFAIFAEIDTTDPKHWKTEVKKIAKKLLV